MISVQKKGSTLLLPLSGVKRNGPWFTQLAVNQHFSLFAISSGDGDGFVSRISPVDVIVDPIDSYAFWGM